MIHRDARKSYEASSAFNQILHREGPAHLAAGDIDTYAEKWFGSQALLRVIEHKLPDQTLGNAQRRVLSRLDKAITLGIHQRLYMPGSGVFIIRGPLGEDGTSNRRKVDFSGRQIVTDLNGNPVLEPRTRCELWDWINGGPGWASRSGRGRWWF